MNVPRLRSLLSSLQRRRIKEPTSGKRAAVLVPFARERRDESREPVWTVLLTTRSHHLRTHAGEVSLVGGGIDEGESFEEAALREAEEEISVDPSLLTVAGLYHDFISLHGIACTPVVAVFNGVLSEATARRETTAMDVVDADAAPHALWPFTPNRDEVAEIFSVPLALFATPTFKSSWRGKALPEFRDSQNRRIWGLSGLILNELLQELRNTGVLET